MRNHHSRRLPAAASAIASTLLDQLASPRDTFWPHEVWPAMQLDSALRVGARGGHGPIRYVVSRHEPGTRVEFRFLAPKGFDGTHRFEITAAGDELELHHVLEMDLRGVARLTWPLMFRPLHDALIEDALAKAQHAAGPRPEVLAWSPWVRILRRLLAGKAARPQRHLLAKTLSIR